VVIIKLNYIVVFIFGIFSFITFTHAYYKNLRKLKIISKDLKKLINEIDIEIESRKLKNIKKIEELVEEKDYIFKEDILNYIREIKLNKNTKKIIDPKYYFNNDVFLKKYTEFSVSENIPSLLTGIGILGTFFGLVLGLMSLNFSEVENIRNTIPSLISAMHISFISSLIAISFSLIYTYISKRRNSNLNKKLIEFNDTLRKYLPIRNESDVLDEIVINQKKQLKANQEFFTDTLIPELVNGVQEAVENSLSPSMNSIDNNIDEFIDSSKTNQEKMYKVLDELAGKSLDKQTESMNKMVNKFINTFNESFENQFNELRETLEDMIKWQKESKKEMESLVSTLNQGAEKQTDMLDYSEKLLSNVQKYVEQFDQLNENLNKNIEQLNNLGEKLSGLESKTNEKLEILIERQEKFDSEKSNHLEKMQKQLDNIDEYWNNVETQFVKLNNNFDNAVDNFAESTHNSLEKTFTIFDDNLSDISNRLAVTIDEINSTLNDIPDSFKKLKNLLDEFKVDREEIIKELEEQELMIDKKLEVIKENITTKDKDLINFLEDINKKLDKDDRQKVIDEIEENINKNMNESITPITKNLMEDKELNQEIITTLREIKNNLENDNSFLSNFRRG